jgi:hypothetical protein
MYLTNLDVDYGLCKTSIMHQQLSGYEIEEKLHLGVLEQTKNAKYHWYIGFWWQIQKERNY